MAWRRHRCVCFLDGCLFAVFFFSNLLSRLLRILFPLASSFNSRILLLLISCYLYHHILVAQCSPPVCSLSLHLFFVFLLISVYLYISSLAPTLFSVCWRMLLIVWSVKPLGLVKTPSWSHLASLPSHYEVHRHVNLYQTKPINENSIPAALY